MRDWSNYSIRDIQFKKTKQDIPFLQLFLSDYKALTGAKSVNANCTSCLSAYLQEYKLKTTKMANNKEKSFVIHKAYLGAPLGFNTGKFIQTETPNEEEVAQILGRQGLKVFRVLPSGFGPSEAKKLINKYVTPKKVKSTNTAEENKVSWQSRVKKIKQAETLEELADLLDGEKSKKVIEAGGIRRNEIVAMIPDEEK